jgi:hypothetical protein
MVVGAAVVAGVDVVGVPDGALVVVVVELEVVDAGDVVGLPAAC